MVSWGRESYKLRGGIIEFRNDLSQEKLAIAEAVVAMCALLKKQDGRALTLKAIADRVDRAGYPGTGAWSLSRYRSGENLPPEQFLRALHQAACEDAGLELVGVTVDELVKLWREAKDVRKEVRSLRAEIAILRGEAESRRAEEAGLTARSAATGQETLLPVPSVNGDRQRSSHDDAPLRDPAVVRFVSRATELLAEGMHEEVLGLLREAPQLLSPGQTAECVALFRQRKLDTLADTSIRALSRDQSDKDILRLALSLVDARMTEDAGTLLRLASE